ncbi:molybdenum cofactor synthesis domain-containing protein [Humidesulfovibrio mexicanus]|uniref:Molybdopterin molybdenumtransferase n=2 Tax=Humidesulfovibrio mexicanus TaxID=147047 RepID=A0A238YFZ6_9BACT|nr:molybdenum cofactor synthesis domain-containing protein [Humidesulfovibrio mexicanus]
MGWATRMLELPVSDSVGAVLCHDITQIVPGQCKRALFRKGHIVRPEDVPALLQLGKEHLYVFDLAEGLVHEEEAATRVARAVSGPGVLMGPPGEGKVTLSAALDGLLKVDADRLRLLNGMDDLVLSTLHNNQMVRKGQNLAGAHITPLVIEEHKVRRVEELCAPVPGGGPIVEVRPLRRARVGMVTTGSEVFKGRIEDGFGPVLRAKFAQLGSDVVRQLLVSDDEDMTVNAIRALLDLGADFIVVTGGMSVDPDDRTPAAIRKAGAEVVCYGAPVLPGAMFLLGYLGKTPILGLPGCVMYYKSSVFDLVVPRLLAGDRLSRSDIAALGHGGYCSACAECRFPMCPFGKGA